MTYCDEPELEDVRCALDAQEQETYDGPALTALLDWSDKAAPHLALLAAEPRSPESYARLARLVARMAVDRPHSAVVGLLGDLLERETPFAGVELLAALSLCSRSPDVLRALSARPGFEPALRRVTAGPGGRVSSVFARTAAALGWTHAVPELRALLDDADLQRREAAAEALAALTGETVVARRAPVAFPQTELRSDLLAGPTPAASRGLDGDWPRPVELADPRLGRVTATPVGVRYAPYLVGLDARGEERWAFLPQGGGIEEMVPLWSEGGAWGVAVLAERAVVALDSAGVELWRLPGAALPSIGLSAHRDLPGVLALHGRGVQLLAHDPSGARELGPRAEVGLATCAVLFPGAAGGGSAAADPAVIVAPSSGEPALVRLDGAGRVRWRAQVSGHVDGVALLEPAGAPRLVAAATSRGELFVADVDGALRWTGALPAPEGEVAPSVLGLDAEERDGAWSLVAHAFHGSFAWRLDVARLA